MRHVERLLGAFVERHMSGRSLAAQKPVDRDPESGRKLLEGRAGHVPPLASFDERGVPEREVRALVDSSGGKTKALARGTYAVGEVHEDSCTLKYNCMQGTQLNEGVVVRRRPTENARVPKKRVKPGKVSPVIERIEERRIELGWTQAQLSKKAKLGVSTVTKAVARGSSPRVDTAMSIARALGTSLDELAGAYPMSLEQSFVDLERWAHATPAVSQVLSLQGGAVTVGDLLRYRASPSSRGEHEAEDVWAMMLAMRSGPIDTSRGIDVSPDNESEALNLPKRKKSR